MNKLKFLEDFRLLQQEFDVKIKQLEIEAAKFVDDTTNLIEDREEVFHAFNMSKEFTCVTWLPQEAKDAFEDMSHYSERYATIDVMARISWVDDEEEYARLMDIALRHRVESFVNDW